MQPVYITDPAWRTSFQHLVAPLPDEWLPGLLLRCDEAHGWLAGTTLTLFRRAAKWNAKLGPTLTVPSALNLSFLVQRLDLSTDDLLATTYTHELARCYGTLQPHFRQLSATFRFSFCPECLVQNRKLQRKFLLPYITCCPEHHLTLVSACHCGMTLSLYSRNREQPFTCGSCGLDWARFPRRLATLQRIRYEQKVLSCYEFFFRKGTPELLKRAWQFVIHKLKEKALEHIRHPFSRESQMYAYNLLFKYNKLLSQERNDESQVFSLYGGDLLMVHFFRGNVVLGDFVGLLANLDLTLIHDIYTPG
jgi:TniQ